MFYKSEETIYCFSCFSPVVISSKLKKIHWRLSTRVQTYFGLSRLNAQD